MARKVITPAQICEQRLRWVHLDFHTSELIKDVGTEFDPDEFGSTLNKARVNLITLFGKCHHGMSYYPTKTGTMHPGLKFDLLGKQIKACRKYNIATPVYVSVKVDVHMGRQNLGWVNRTKDGRPWCPSPMEAAWYNMCMNNPEYYKYVEDQAVEIMKRYDPEGIWFDMCYPAPYPGCFCQRCLERMDKEGFDRNDDAKHWDMEYRIIREYTRELAKAVRRIKPNAMLFFNSRVTPNVRNELDVLTHLEIESLPTVPGWGYLFFPFMARMCRTLNRRYIGQTARFHKSWGDFGGLKTEDQLEYEMGAILGAGAGMGIGDQLHPRGKLNKGVYEIVGATYKKLEEREPWCVGAKAIAEIAVLMLPDKPDASVEIGSPWEGMLFNDSRFGAGAMLQELKHQWNVESTQGNFDQYKVLVLPDKGACGPALRKKLSAFLLKGGSVILSHEATLDKNTGKFACPGIGAKYVKPCEFIPSFMKLDTALGKGLVQTPWAMYEESSLVKKTAGGAKSMGNVCSSYFNRDYRHFCSHFQSPPDKTLPYPVAVQKGRVIYIYGSIFKGYHLHGYHAYKTIFANALNMLLKEPLIRANAPASMEIDVLKQKGRLVVHLVNFQPQRRHGIMEYIETIYPVRDVLLHIRTAKKPSRVYLAPQEIDIPFEMAGNCAVVSVPEVRGHQMVVLE